MARETTRETVKVANVFEITMFVPPLEILPIARWLLGPSSPAFGMLPSHTGRSCLVHVPGYQNSVPNYYLVVGSGSSVRSFVLRYLATNMN
jgi:hypothetical protein